ncbi:MAG TPA: 50S ribosomal protein L3 [Candidatus Aminicenantes bacterium]|nr:50S ribosomal protein L3 [Candidatus Aminicenantes bacterium]HRY65502.1 50S ribosomal protein L3 [Candidatus Aminicenantes bacterium]HRZ72030.1 50S ribosomal protein L3 [Candidatus Aminicenantes bacterium]
MIQGLIAKKIGMSQQFDDAGNVVPVTVLKAGPCTVIQKKTPETDGYPAVQLGFVEERAVRRATKPQTGHFKKSGVPVVKKLQEVGCSDLAAVKEGDQVLVDIFEIGETIDVIGTSKGKGFAGVVKRHHFAGGDAAHGSMFHRAPGSIGASSYPSRVIKGMRMGGHMGHDRVTVRKLKVVATDKDQNLLIVKGAVPGAKGGYVLVRKAAPAPARAK